MSTHEADALDQADMARLAAGHEAALSVLMDRHAGALFGFLCRFVRDEDAANDLFTLRRHRRLGRRPARALACPSIQAMHSRWSCRS